MTTIVSTDWDTPSEGADGWSYYNSQITHEENGGNPGGYLSVQAIFLSTIFNSTSDYTGNFVQKGYNHISFDIMFPQALPANKDNYTGDIRLNSTDGAEWYFIVRDFVPSQTGVWQHVDIIFDPTWEDNEAVANGWQSRTNSDAPNYRSFHHVAENVHRFAFYRGYYTNQHLIGFDNFKLSNFIPDPIAEVEDIPFKQALSSWDVPSEDVNGWEAYGSTLHFFEHRSGGGNPGGYVMVRGHGSLNISNEQPAYIGNYSQKAANFISIDILVPQPLPVVDGDSHIATITVNSENRGKWNYALKDLDVTKTGVWQHLEVPFNPNWIDADAKANGWHSGYANGASFRDVMAGVQSLSFSRYYSNAVYDLGIDNFKLANIVSEPLHFQKENLKKVDKSRVKVPQKATKTVVKPIRTKRPGKKNIPKTI